MQALDGDRRIDLGGRLSRALVARLALDAGRPVRPDVLVEDLWGPGLPQDPANALQSVVSRTRRRLPAGTLVSTPAGYVLRTGVDLTAFREFVAQGRADRALALWRGEPLADLDGFPFVTALAGELAETRLAAVEQDLAGRPPGPEVIAELAALVRDHPYREGLWLARLRALATCGRGNEALVAYEDLRRRLAEDLGTDPSPALRDLHTRILRGQEPLRCPRGGPDVPGPWTSFVGREEAVREVLAALDEHRLVTLLGPGGAGKSRLAVESARDDSNRFAPVRLVELAPVTEADLFPALRTALGQAGPLLDRWGAVSSQDLATRLLDALADLDGLLILDNCEHIVGPVADLTEKILTLNPRVRVLATSREALRITGECAYPLEPLRIPGDRLPAQRAGAVGAVRLFTERARAVDRDFVLDDGSLPAVREICRRLDGQPLAIELAAARLRTLTAEEIAARLSDRFALLSRGSRTAPPRHRTLRAVVGWSWDLLEESERDLAERIAVFPGGVTAAGAAAVLAAGAAPHAVDGSHGVRPADVERMLDSLAEKSLLTHVRGTRRFRMLETLREYGLERLAARGIDAEVRRAFRRHHLETLRTLEPWIRNGRQIEAIDTIGAERDNLVAALNQAIADGDRDMAAQLVAGLVWFWSIRDEHPAVDGWVTSVLRMPGPISPAGEILCAAGALAGCFVLPRADREPEPLVDRILRLWDRHRPDDSFVILVMRTLEYFGLTGDRDLPEPQDRWTCLMINLMRLIMDENTGRLGPNGRGDLDEVLAGFRDNGDRWGLAVCLAMRGTVEAYGGLFQQALDTWKQAQDLLVLVDAPVDLIVSRIRIDCLRIAAADDARRRALHQEFLLDLRRAQDAQDRREQALAHLACGNLAHACGDERTARSHLIAHLRCAGDLATFAEGHLRSMVLASLAIVEMACGETESARARLALAARSVASMRDMPLIAYVGTATACLVQMSGNDAGAAGVLGATVALRGQEDLSNHDARTLGHRLRKSLGVAAFESLYERGRCLPAREATALVLAPVPPPV